MSSKTKIVVLRMKEIIYTIVFLVLGILLIFMLYFMFGPNDSAIDASAPMYTPGVYTSTLTLSNATLEVEVSVDESHINSIRFSNLDEAVATAYPLIQPTIEEIATQIYDTQSLESLSFSEDTEYTSQAIVATINSALEKATLE